MFAVVFGWLALLLIGGSGTLWFRRAHRVRLPENRAYFLVIWVAGLVLGVMSFANGGGVLAAIPAGLAVAGAGFFLLTVAISRQKASSLVIQVGARLPDFTALDENAANFESTTLAGRPVLLKFFRGHW